MDLTSFIPFAGGGGGNGVEALTGLDQVGQIADLGGANPYIFTNVDEFRKAVTAGYGTDVAALTGGGSLRLQSIEGMLLRTIQDETKFRLLNRLDKSNATATIDEFTVKERIGGYFGSAFNDELGVIAEAQGSYERRTLKMKYLMTRRRVSVVQDSQKTLVDTIAEEKKDGTLELLTSAEWGCFFGDETVNPNEFDGAMVQILASGDTDLVIDAAGGGLSAFADEIITLSATISDEGRWGQATDFFSSLRVQSDELSKKLDPAFRVPVQGVSGGGVQVGTPVRGIRTDFGDIATNHDVFIQEGQMPWEAKAGVYAGLITAAALTAPVIASAVAAPNASSKFAATHAGNYYWGVESIGKLGRSTTVVSAQVSVAAGDGVTITITNPGDTNVTGYYIHRSRKNGTNAKTDLREMIRVGRQAGASTVFVDLNAWVPGSSVAFVFNLKPGDKAITLRRLLPLTMFPLYPTNTAEKPWAQLLFCGLRLGKRRQHGLIKNIVPASQQWRPF